MWFGPAVAAELAAPPAEPPDPPPPPPPSPALLQADAAAEGESAAAEPSGSRESQEHLLVLPHLPKKFEGSLKERLTCLAKCLARVVPAAR